MSIRRGDQLLDCAGGAGATAGPVETPTLAHFVALVSLIGTLPIRGMRHRSRSATAPPHRIETTLRQWSTRTTCRSPSGWNSQLRRQDCPRPQPGASTMPELDTTEPRADLSQRARERLHRQSGFNGRPSGWVAPGFEARRVRAQLRRARRDRRGRRCVLARREGGRSVGRPPRPEGDAPWNEDTMVVVKSTTKGLAAMTLAVANARGWLDYDAPVARYWPEFAQNGKGAITVRQLLGHEAGLVLLDEKLQVEELRDLDYVARVLARQKPGVAAGHATRLPHDDARAVHAGADPARRPGAPHARPVLPRGDRGAARARVLHRAAAGDPRRAARTGQDVSRVARLLALPHTAAGYVLRILGRGRCCAGRCCSQTFTRTIALGSRSRSRQATALVRRARSRGPTRRSPRAARSSASRQRRWRA